MCATACQCEMCQLLAEQLTYPSFQTTLSCTDETSKVETGLSADLQLVYEFFISFSIRIKLQKAKVSLRDHLDVINAKLEKGKENIFCFPVIQMLLHWKSHLTTGLS